MTFVGRDKKRLKVMILGACGVGKSSLARRICTGEFMPKYSETMGIDVSVVNVIDEQGEDCAVEIWSCSGVLRYLPIVQQNYVGTDVAVIIYDMGSLESLKACVFWRNEILRGSQNARVLLVGNKLDLEDQVVVSEESALKMSESWGIAHYRISCKNGFGCEALRERIADASV